MTKEPSFLFYDYETFGINPAKDRIAQFAAIRTDFNFNIIDEPINIYCKQYDDYIPSPEAILITGITPDECNQKGLDEHLFAKKIFAEFNQPNTCVLGYNSIRFDDEMSRYLFYRNFLDPYSYLWKNGNSRWDLLDIVRATFALRPQGINWPMIEDKTSLKLEELSKANHLNHYKAHDALSDVYATIAIAKLIQTKQPKLFDYFFNHRTAKSLIPIIESHWLKPLVHVSGMFGEVRNYLSIISPICFHPSNKNAVICLDLSQNLSHLINYSVDELKTFLYTATDNLPPNIERPPIKLIHLNKAPIIAPISVLQDSPHSKVFDPADISQKIAFISGHNDLLIEKISTIFASDFQQNKISLENAESALYSGFFDNFDKKLFEEINHFEEEHFTNYHPHFHDKRADYLWLLYRAKNFPKSLNETEKSLWYEHKTAQINLLKHEYTQLYAQLLQDNSLDDTKKSLLISCQPYYSK